ncbi:hypothetical protein, partial [Klebsiella pneumoniae]|uniref:hypothetical protein n=1 Tax=Klebsiella pneumoniae TaxID=573 RepID=UPI0039C4B177
MSIQVEDYFARATFDKMKAFADKQETPFVVSDTQSPEFLALNPNAPWRQRQERAASRMRLT